MKPWVLALGLAAFGCDDGGPSPTDTGTPGGTAADTGGTGNAEADGDTGTESEATDATTDSPPGELGDQCNEDADNCGEGLRCLFGICEYACGDAPQCCPDGMICGGIEYECRPPAEDWCGHACDGQQWHECKPGQTCTVDPEGQGTCTH